jgi:hypothetical protein
MEITMTNDIETLIRDAAPRTTSASNTMAAILQVGDEAAAAARSQSRRVRRRWIAGVASIAALALGTNAAAAATQTLWWSAPNTVVEPTMPVGGHVLPATEVDEVLSATFAKGVDGNAAAAKSAFRLAQSWLVDHPVVVPVPKSAQTLTAAETQTAAKQNVPTKVALDGKAMTATEDALSTAVAAGHDKLVAGLDAYLTQQGANPRLIAVEAKAGLKTVEH